MVSHNLQIEPGRYQRNPVPKAERLCKCGEVEDEKHFVLYCNNYSHIRNKYTNLKNLEFHEQLDNLKTPDFIYELNNCRDIYH